MPSPSLLDNPFQDVHSTSALYTINIRSFFLQKRDRIVFLSVVIILLTLILPLSHDIYYENSLLSNTIFCTNNLNNARTNQIFSTDEWSDIIHCNSYVSNHPFIKNCQFSDHFPQILKSIPTVYIIFVEYAIKFVIYMFLLMIYWRFHNVMNKLFRFLLLNETIEMENEAKQQRPSGGSHHLYLLCSEVSRCLCSSIWIMSVQMVLGRYAPAFLWILVYSCLGSVALEMSKKPSIDSKQQQPHVQPSPSSAPIYRRAFDILRKLTIATHATTYITITVMVICELFVMIYYLKYSVSFCSCVVVSILIVQVMTIELIDFMRNHSIEFVQQREVQSMQKVANLYKNLYMSAPDTFISCVCDSDDVLLRSSKRKVQSAYTFLQSFKIIQYNNTAVDTLACASSLTVNPDYNQSDHEVTLADVIINPYTESAEVMKTAALGGNLLSVNDLQNSAVLKLEEVLQDVIRSPLDQQMSTHERILPLFVKGKNQTILTCSLSISKILLYDIDSTGEGMVFFNIILHDITQKYKLLDEINVEKEKAIEANKAKSQFLAQMSHELRTPLHGIIGLTDVLLSKCKESENKKKLNHFGQTEAINFSNVSKDSVAFSFVEGDKALSPVMEQQTNIIQTIRYSGNILLGLINDLLDICKIESSKIKLENKKFNLRRAIDQIHCGMFQLQAREKSLEFNLQLGDNVPTFVVGDENRLVQILINLVYNAIKFTDQGAVSLIIESKPPSEDNLYEITFKVTDTGIGISQHDVKSLFQPFTQILSNSHKQTKINEGTGLGLYICKQLVEMMRGNLRVDSEEGVGSTFWFTISLHGEFIPGFEDETRSKILSKNFSSKSLSENCKPLTPVRSPTIEDFETTLPNLKILIVEDNAINRIVLINMLKKIGCTNIAVAQDGLEGVEQFENFKSSNQSFDIIFIDIFMPRLDGYGTVRRILELESNDPSDHHSILVALTANGFEETRNYCLEHGFDVFMSKPFSITDLEQCVTNCLTRIHPSSTIP